jgi:hypothetical protein
VAGDAIQLPFRDNSFDAVICSLTFHHLTNAECVSVLREMWRVARRIVIVNDLHRNRVAHASIRILSALFSRSTMFRNDSAASVRPAFRPAELVDVAKGRCSGSSLSELSVSSGSGGHQMRKVDVAIIGASLAGASCVRTLTRAGIDAVAIERIDFQRESLRRVSLARSRGDPGGTGSPG